MLNSDYDNNENEEELNQSEIQEVQINNINQTGMIITKNGDMAINSLTIIGQIVITGSEIYPQIYLQAAFLFQIIL